MTAVLPLAVAPSPASHDSAGALHLDAAVLASSAAAASGSRVADVVDEFVSIRKGDSDPDTCQLMLLDQAAVFALGGNAPPVPRPIRFAARDA